MMDCNCAKRFVDANEMKMIIVENWADLGTGESENYHLNETKKEFNNSSRWQSKISSQPPENCYEDSDEKITTSHPTYNENIVPKRKKKVHRNTTPDTCYVRRVREVQLMLLDLERKPKI